MFHSLQNERLITFTSTKKPHSSSSQSERAAPGGRRVSFQTDLLCFHILRIVIQARKSRADK